MASAIITGSELRIYAESPQGARILLGKGDTGYWGPGGSPDAVRANTPEKWAYIPLHSLVLTGGWKIIPAVKLGTADGADASDGAWLVPVTVRGVGLRHLSVTDLGGTDLVAATTATVEHDFGTGYTVPQGYEIRFGGGKIWMSAESDD